MKTRRKINMILRPVYCTKIEPKTSCPSSIFATYPRVFYCSFRVLGAMCGSGKIEINHVHSLGGKADGLRVDTTASYLHLCNPRPSRLPEHLYINPYICRQPCQCQHGCSFFTFTAVL